MRRRHFLIAAASGLSLPFAPSWAAAGAPGYLSAGNKRDNSTWLVGLTLYGEARFALPLPGRGHAASAHPERAEAVAFARRPGRFAVVIDCTTGAELARLTPPEGLHFYGHGAFTADGRYLLTTENAYDVPDGRIGVWDSEKGYARVGDFASGGIGPHEIRRMADGTFAIANGGIQTHPDFERAKLNLPTMQTNLSIVSSTGAMIESIPLTGGMRQNSIRHIDIDRHGTVFAALQWQGAPTEHVPLVARFQPGSGTAPELIEHPETARLKQYAGSIAVSHEGDLIAVTGPKGDHVLFLAPDGHPEGGADLSVASGAAKTPDGLAITHAGGLALFAGGKMEIRPVDGDWRWDNHLVRIG